MNKPAVVEYITEDFGDFKVHSIKENYSFFHIDILNENLFLDGICDYLLSEDNLLKYAENSAAISFEPTRKNYTTLYKLLYLFIDDENMPTVGIEKDIESVLIDEFEEVTNDEGKREIRLSKIGRLGEYIFHVFLSEYFTFNCIIPKIKMTTDKNMSVYGIDLLFIDKFKKMIMFGESKVTKSVDNGIAMINKSLTHYEKEIKEEFILVLSNNHLKLNCLEEVFVGQHELCITFEEFVEKTDTQHIGIPIFIAHGGEVEHKKILKRLSTNIKRHSFFGLNTVYFVISLPIINKDNFFQHITKSIKAKMEEYNEKL